MLFINESDTRLHKIDSALKQEFFSIFFVL